MKRLIVRGLGGIAFLLGTAMLLSSMHVLLDPQGAQMSNDEDPFWFATFAT
jgi:hypothetical protein